MDRVLLLSVVVALLGPALPGCLLQNISASETLRDSVVGLNDELRWQRMDLAVDRVAPSFRQEFVHAHGRWGGEVQVADTELLRVRIDDEDGSATSLVAVRWYSMRTMTLHQSTLEQNWERAGRYFILTSEDVVGGDERIFADEPGPVLHAAEGK